MSAGTGGGGGSGGGSIRGVDVRLGDSRRGAGRRLIAAFSSRFTSRFSSAVFERAHGGGGPSGSGGRLEPAEALPGRPGGGAEGPDLGLRVASSVDPFERHGTITSLLCLRPSPFMDESGGG